MHVSNVGVFLSGCTLTVIFVVRSYVLSGKGTCCTAKFVHAFKGGFIGLSFSTPSLIEAYEGWPESFISLNPTHFGSQ